MVSMINKVNVRSRGPPTMAAHRTVKVLVAVVGPDNC